VNHSFAIKELDLPLFGLVEAEDKELFRTGFASGGQARRLEIDDAALDLVAEQLGLDAEGLVGDAARYTAGLYREKASGLAGGRLGDLGEVLAYLIQRKRVPLHPPIRLLSWRANGLKVPGNKFPVPDFLLEDGNQAGVLEVKASEALDYQHLLKRKKATELRPCDEIAKCRERALAQLGHTKKPQHKLLAADGRVVPFPSNFGVAAAVLAVDGRLSRLRGVPKFKTPLSCESSSTPRECWKCLGLEAAPHQFIVAFMRNSPGKLPLVSLDEGPNGWISAYHRWSQALWARALAPLREATGALVRETVSWLDPRSGLAKGEQDLLRGFWGSYIRDLSAEKGIRLPDGLVHLPSLKDVSPSLGWEPTVGAVPKVQDVNFKQKMQSWRIDDPTPTQWCFASSSAFRDDKGPEDHFTFGSGPEGWYILCLPYELGSGTSAGRSSEGDSNGMADRVASRLVALGLSISMGDQAAIQYGSLPLRRVSVKISDDLLGVGWTVKTALEDPTAWENWFFVQRLQGSDVYWPPWRAEFRDARLTWAVLLAMGDPRVRLQVFFDGRGLLRVPRLPSHGALAGA